MNIEEAAKTLYGIRAEIIDEAVRLEREADALKEPSHVKNDSIFTDLPTLLGMGRRDVWRRSLLRRHDVAINVARQINEVISSLAVLEDK